MEHKVTDKVDLTTPISHAFAKKCLFAMLDAIDAAQYRA